MNILVPKIGAIHIAPLPTHKNYDPLENVSNDFDEISTHYADTFPSK
jgi:hypothetical protein